MKRKLTFDEVKPDRRPLCSCGKVSFTKAEAHFKMKSLLKMGRVSALRSYPCPESNTWHITKSFNGYGHHD